MRLVTIIGSFLACLTLFGVAHASDWEPNRVDLKLKQSVGTTQLSQSLKDASAIGAKTFRDEKGFGLNIYKPGNSLTLGATMGFREEEWGCGKRVFSFMNTEKEEIFFVFDDYSAPALNLLCPKDHVNPASRLSVTVIEKGTNAVSTSVLESN